MTEQPEPRKSGVQRLSTAAWAILTALVALAGSVIGVAFDLVPRLKPDPLDQIGAAVTIFAVEPRVRIDDWAQRAYGERAREVLADIAKTDPPPPDLLANRGSVIYVRTQVDGYKHREVALRTSVYDSDGCRTRTGRCRLDFARFAQIPNIPPLKIDAPDRSSVQLLFIPGLQDLRQPKDTFVRVELVDVPEEDDDEAATLAVVDTGVLRFGVALPERR